jgi:hypothetical protein
VKPRSRRLFASFSVLLAPIRLKMIFGGEFMKEEEKRDNWWHDNPDNLLKLMNSLWQLGFNVKLETAECDIKMTITIREANTCNVPKAVGGRVRRSPQ